ncbi:MAG: hypothetical protein J6P98_01950 [Clostridia bacterium]|nr:hypothetical protein [Clostridia bacterium]
MRKGFTPLKRAALAIATALLAAALPLALFSGCVLSLLGNSRFYREFPSGFTSKEEHFDPEGFQDYVDYCKYFYEDAEGFLADGRFVPVSEVGEDRVAGYFGDLKNWMELADRLSEYDFDARVISGDDLVRIESEPHFTEYDDYSLWFFDAETCIMYYIHANI